MLIPVYNIFVQISHLGGSLLIGSVRMRPAPCLDYLTLLGLPELQQFLDEASPAQLDVLPTEVDLEVHYRHTSRISHKLFETKVKLAIFLLQSKIRLF